MGKKDMSRRTAFTWAAGLGTLVASGGTVLSSETTAASTNRLPEAALEPAALENPAANDRVRLVRLKLLQYSLARICEATKISPLAPADYAVLFALMAASPKGTAETLAARARQHGVELPPEDIVFVRRAVGQTQDESGGTCTAAALARRCCGFVRATCHHAGVTLSEYEHEIIDVWFGYRPGDQDSDNADLSVAC
jgi:hypothetical protein